MAFSEKFFKIIKHLLPKSNAFSIFLQKTLTKFFEGLTAIPDDYRNYLHQVFLDIFPSTTRELTMWKDEYGKIYFPLVKTYLCIAHYVSPYLTIYKRSGDTFTKLANPATLPTGIGISAAFSADGTYLCIAHYVSPYLTIYKRSGDTFTKLPDPATLPTGAGRSAAFSVDGIYLCIAHNTSPYLTIYKRSRNGIFEIENAEVSAERENEFKSLILKLKPTQSWCLLIVTYV